MISFSEIAIGTGGELACTRCSSESASGAPADFSQVALSIAGAIAAWNSGPGPNVRFAGFEPFLHPELPALVTAAAEAGAERIQLRTDCGALSQPGNAAGALHAGVTHVEAVLLAGDAAHHDDLAGAAGLFDACRDGLRAFRDAADAAGAHVAVTGAVPVCRHNVAHLASAVAAFASMGALSVRLEVSPAAAASVGFSAALKAALETGTVNGVWVSVTGVEPSGLPVSVLHAVEPFVVLGAAS